MVYFIYDNHLLSNGNNLYACIAINKKSDGSTESKFTSIEINENDDILEKWPWLKSNNTYNIKVYVPEDFISYISLVQDFLLTYENKEITNSNVQVEDKHLEELRNAVLYIKYFLYFNENPGNINEFELFYEFKEKYGLGDDYLLEDWLVEMEELFEKINVRGE